jgi:hypothetical protein
MEGGLGPIVAALQRAEHEEKMASLTGQVLPRVPIPDADSN